MNTTIRLANGLTKHLHLEVQGLRLHYWQGGHGSDVVMVHGLGANLALWHFTLAADLLPFHRLSMYDLRGHGRSDIPAEGYTSRAMAADLLGVFDELKIRTACLVGHSFGADIALHFAMLYPKRVDRIVAVEAGLPALTDGRRRREWSGWEEWASVLQAEARLRKSADDWHRIYGRLRQGQSVPELAAHEGELPPRGRRLVRLLTATSVVRDYERPGDMTHEGLSRVRCPVLLVCGEDSAYMGALEILRQALPHARTMTVPEADHFSVMQRGEPLATALVRFLAV